MEVFLYNSTVCRLCGEENDSGNLLYSSEENNQNLCEIINTYLPIKVFDDGILPRTICPGCSIQLEATVEFFDLIINGQKVIRELHQREKEYKKTVLSANSDEPEVITENVIYEISSNGVYKVDHPIALQMAGVDKPKRKRGRPPKKPKSPEEIAQEAAAREKELAAKKQVTDEEVSGKRRRKAPTRFQEAVQGPELERIFIEEGVIDEESEADVKPDVDVEEKPPVAEREVIGHVEQSGELVVVVKGKGRGRPKGRMRQTREECAICGMEFSCVGRYMSHIAQHGPVVYQCVACEHSSTTLIEHQTHQRETGHAGQNVMPCNVESEPVKKEPVVTQAQDPQTHVETRVTITPMTSLPTLDDIPAKDDLDPPTDLVKSFVNGKTSDEGGATPIIDITDDNTEKPSEKPEEVGPKGKVRVKCNHCDKTFNSKQSKSLHIKAVHQGEKPYVCSECGCKFAYPRSLALHAISHRRHRAVARRYACDLCGKVLNHPSSVVYHKEAEHAGQKWVCSACGKSFKHRQLLQRHQLVHSQARPYSCKTCNASFKTKANLINHQLLHTGVKKFSCDICKHKFAHKTSLTLHMRWHTGSKPFACKTCGKSFSQKGNLSEHERIHTGEKPYQCSLCPRRFTTSSQFRLHARRHAPERPYACPQCPKRFVSRGSWLAHQRREAGVREHVCSVCTRSFSERWALVKHMRKHTGERPFRCPHCPRTFADCSNLNKHKKQIHKQISLLVNSDKLQQQSPEQVVSPKTDPDPLVVAPSDSDGEMEEGVIYVTYDVEDNEPSYTILDADQAAAIQEEAKVVQTCEVYGGASLLVSQEQALQALELSQYSQLSQFSQLSPALQLAHDPELPLDGGETISVTDEQGNPLHFTMQDGTRLAVTSSDGKSLQVITQDGQTIPVEINELNEDEEVEEISEPETVVHQMNIQKTVDDDASSPVTHYFTIV